MNLQNRPTEEQNQMVKMTNHDRQMTIVTLVTGTYKFTHRFRAISVDKIAVLHERINHATQMNRIRV